MTKLDDQINQLDCTDFTHEQIKRILAWHKKSLTLTLQEIMPEREELLNNPLEIVDLVTREEEGRRKGVNQAVSQIQERAKELGIELE